MSQLIRHRFYRFILFFAFVLAGAPTWAQFGDNLDPFNKGAVCIPCATLPNDLVAYWNLNESSGTRSDSVGSADLTPFNSVTQESGVAGTNAASMSLVTSYLTTADQAALDVGGGISFTFQAWAYLTSKAAHRFVLAKSANDEYGLLYHQTLDRYAFFYFDSGANLVIVQADNYGSPSTGVWAHLLTWYDAGAGTLNIQVNNGTANSVSNGGLVPHSSTASFQVGAYRTGDPSSLLGRVDEVALWKRLLTAPEKTYLYNAGTGRTLYAWLDMWWPGLRRYAELDFRFWLSADDLRLAVA